MGEGDFLRGEHFLSRAEKGEGREALDNLNNVPSNSDGNSSHIGALPVDHHPPSWKVAQLMELQGDPTTFTFPAKRHLHRDISSCDVIFLMVLLVGKEEGIYNLSNPTPDLQTSAHSLYLYLFRGWLQ